jgi:hypothetical protein
MRVASAQANCNQVELHAGACRQQAKEKLAACNLIKGENQQAAAEMEPKKR